MLDILGSALGLRGQMTDGTKEHTAHASGRRVILELQGVAIFRSFAQRVQKHGEVHLQPLVKAIADSLALGLGDSMLIFIDAVRRLADG